MKISQYITPRHAFLLSLMMSAAGLASSNSLMSWGQFGLGIAVVWSGNWREKFQNLKKNRYLLGLASIFLFFLIGMIYSKNIEEGLFQLKLKLPLLVIPLLVSTFTPITKTELKWIFHAIFGGVIASMIAGILVYFEILEPSVSDMRKYSPLISNVRLGTILVFSIFSCVYIVVTKQLKLLHDTFYIVFIILCFGFLAVIQSLTGYIAFIFLLLVTSFYFLIKYRKYLLFSITILVSIVVIVISYQLFMTEWNRVHILDKVNFSELPKSTKEGTLYRHDTLSSYTINGHYVWHNVCFFEINKAWSKRSSFSPKDNNKIGYNITETLIKYLTSKGLKKNRESVESLSDNEIRAIEKGVYNYVYLNPLDIRWRFHQISEELFYYHLSQDPNDKSLAIRLEIWKHTISVIKRTIFFGVGTGDAQDELNLELKSSKTKLKKEKWMNPHNQYLSLLLSLGLIFTIIILVLIFNPLIAIKKIHFLFLVTLSISFVSFLNENVFDTQAGCTQFILLLVICYYLHIVNERQ